MAKSVTPLIGGFNPNSVDASPVVAIGTTVVLDDGGNGTYVQALSEISTYAAVAVFDTMKAQMLTTTNSATSKWIAVAQVSIPSGYYGWVVRGGKFLVNLAANCAPSVPLYTTATAGVLDDATVSAGQVGGVVATTSISNATAVTCIGSNPNIRSVG